MHKVGNKAFSAVLILSFMLGTLPPAAFSASKPGDYGRFRTLDDENNNLDIGIPNLTRRVNKELPEIDRKQGIKAGYLKLHPSFSTTYEFDDNVSLANSQREKELQDSIFIQRPGIAAEAKVGNHRIEGGYGMEIHNFAKFTEENKINHLAYGLGEFNFNDFRLLVEDNYERSTSRLFSETSERDRLSINEAHVLGVYDRPRWATELGWTHNTVSHVTDTFKLNNYDEDIYALLGGYKVLPKTLLLAEIDIGNVYYDKKVIAADQTYVQLLGGVRGKPTEAIDMTAKVGVQNRQLADVPGEGRQTDYQGLVVDSDVTYRITEADVVRMGYDRTVKTSTFNANSWYREDKIYFSYRKRFLSKWYLTPTISWQMNDYPEGSTIGSETLKRTDHFLQTGVGLRYKIREWAWAGIAYNFRGRDSNFNSFDYDNNRFIADLSLAY